ncbi:MAG: BamA/TamA family outer membrane protein [Bacteroidota bacterium]
MPYRFFLALFLFILTVRSFPQAFNDSVARQDSSSIQAPCPPKDLFDVLWKKKNQKTKPEKKLNYFVLPTVGYTPVTRISFGIASPLSWRFGKDPFTNLSVTHISVYFTTKRQLVCQVKSNIYTSGNEWYFLGDWRYYLFHLDTYGLGTLGGDEVPAVPGYTSTYKKSNKKFVEYPMSFEWLKFHQVISRKIVKDLYAGIGFHYDYHFNIDDKKLNMNEANQVITPHYAYSTLHGFNPSRYISSGASLNLTYDTRDNTINPYRGFYVNLSYRNNFTWLGSSQNGSILWTEFRSYVSLSKRFPRYLIAFWYYGSFKVSGQIPYLDLMSIGFDQMNSSGRGYDQGRWRGENLVYSEVEYRFPITPCSGLIGGVVFFNVTTASSYDQNVQLFVRIRPAGGIGLRIMVSKKDRMNLLIDFGIGEQSNGLNVMAGEAF